MRPAASLPCARSVGRRRSTTWRSSPSSRSCSGSRSASRRWAPRGSSTRSPGRSATRCASSAARPLHAAALEAVHRREQARPAALLRQPAHRPRRPRPLRAARGDVRRHAFGSRSRAAVRRGSRPASAPARACRSRGAGSERPTRLRAAAQLSLGRGTVYVARDEREARAFMRAIGDGRAPGPAREVFYDGGVRALAEVGIGSAWLEGAAATAIGVRRDRRTGEVTVGLSVERRGLGSAHDRLGGPAGAGDRATDARADARPPAPAGRAVAVGRRRDLRRAACRPCCSARSAAPTLAARWAAMAGRRWEIAARLDLRDPQRAGDLGALSRPPGERRRDRRARLRRSATARTSTSAPTAPSTPPAGSPPASPGGRPARRSSTTTSIDRARLLAAASRPARRAVGAATWTASPA